jgi:hypothetical protein
MHYGARFYDPYINRWIQPDTIVPDPGNPQDWNRYAYARNNSLAYIDPDGHFVVAAAILLGAVVVTTIVARVSLELAQPTVDADRVIWRMVPCGFAQYDSFSVSWGTVEGQEVSIEVMHAFNWRTGQLSSAISKGGADLVTTPELVGIEWSKGYSLMYGYSDNDALQGPSNDASLSVQVDNFAKAGVEVVQSLETEIHPGTGRLRNVYDDESHMQPEMVGLGVSGGFNILPNVIEASRGQGASQTYFVRTIQLYVQRQL